jgi:hypothetical protein
MARTSTEDRIAKLEAQLAAAKQAEVTKAANADAKDLEIMAKQDEIIAKANARKDAAALRISERAQTSVSTSTQLTFSTTEVDEV